MMNESRYLYLLALFAKSLAVIMDTGSAPGINNEESSDFNEALGTCLSKKVYGTFECINRGALSTLQLWNEKHELDFGEMRLEKSEGQGRDLLDLDEDPKDFRNVIKAASTLMERRNLRWDLGKMYPGLQMRVGPTLNGNGMLEFVLDERVSKFNDRQAGGTGRTLVKQVLLPFLLGFKFNLVSLIPLVFGILLLVTKKALILTKVAMLLTGFMGWNSIFSGVSGSTSDNLNEYDHGQETLGGNYPYQQLPFRPFGGSQSSGITPYGHVIREMVNVYEPASQLEQEDQSSRNVKNFVWAREE